MAQFDTQDFAIHWDAGEIGCGHLASGVARKLASIEAGELLMLITRDAGAPVDIPAWCRLTGHALVSATHPNYIIRKKGDANV